jgi:hypothetical protein
MTRPIDQAQVQVSQRSEGIKFQGPLHLGACFVESS